MDIQIPKLVVTVDFGEYAPELAGQSLHVWINPPMATLAQYNDLVVAMQERDLDEAAKNMGAAPVNEKASLIGHIRSLVRLKSRLPGVYQTDKGLLEWYAHLWSQGPQETRWTADELRRIEAKDPSFLAWMIERTWQKRAEHIERKKKV